MTNRFRFIRTPNPTNLRRRCFIQKLLSAEPRVRGGREHGAPGEAEEGEPTRKVDLTRMEQRRSLALLTEDLHVDGFRDVDPVVEDGHHDRRLAGEDRVRLGPSKTESKDQIAGFSGALLGSRILRD
jgi:hypothetical protein